ncbi:MAG: hypothetical protein HN742_34375 [Lentisphaerae bacterium]|jgi:hypothetical protein|nr:hypothetical protein [Lentisphaerota bacterium]MBT4822192.1 hypothetical protein [Lentisphaerota bacterium]MBT5605045.1 hypothetical protein [Lentisphaerota bacterium]MBT7058667.1 hypothetical protein [Lentisphaerota bacterium]MBT7847008.1 hypothetical protein [Lentisphaerota bacterium]
MRTGLGTCIALLGLCCLPVNAQVDLRLQLILPAGTNPGSLTVAGVLASDRAMPDGPLPAGSPPVWVGASFPGPIASAVAQCERLSAHGLALIFPGPEGDVLSHSELAPLLKRKRQGEALADRVRSVRRTLPAHRKLAICAPAANTRPETSRGQCVDVPGLVRDGTVDAVLLSGQPSYNFHRLRLLRDEPLLAGVFAVGAGTRVLCADLAAATKNTTAEALWVWQDPKGKAARVISAALTAAEAERRVQRRIAEAITTGALTTVLAVESGVGNNQATVHGVGQTFVAKVGGRCEAVQIYCALRGTRDGFPSPLVVELRDDEGDKPGTAVLARGTVPAAAFGQEPAYRWGTVGFEDGPMLEPGRAYWVHLPTAKGYVWRMVGKGATEATHAWSRLYDYTGHSWVLKVFVRPGKE